MRARDWRDGKRLERALKLFHDRSRRLPGIEENAWRMSFVEQIIESMRRVKYVEMIRKREISEKRTDPKSRLFDPVKAALIYQRKDEIDEAFWMVFLFVHFGKHKRGGWRYAREVYGGMGGERRWGWLGASGDPAGFRAWLHENRERIKAPGIPGGLWGNHRKYQSLDAYSRTGTGAAVESYVEWVGPPRTHKEMMEQAYQRANHESRKAFDILYKSMNSIASFGRTARFDYLTMVAKLELARIEAGSTYMEGATGPLAGARLLFGVETSIRQFDEWLIELAASLGVGMQVLEDALCNWQKGPEEFVPFRE